VIGKNNNLIVQERNKWLKKFAEEKVFTQKEIEDALAEPLTASRGTVPHYLPHLSYKLKIRGWQYCSYQHHHEHAGKN
jgi:penicillin-binding protein 1C